MFMKNVMRLVVIVSMGTLGMHVLMAAGKGFIAI